MSMDPDRFAGEVARRLDAVAEQGRDVAFWWRDDDAVADTAALQRLLELAGRHAAPLCLAVIPRDAEESLASALAAHDKVWVSQHGWAHENHQAKGEKAAELGEARPVEAVLAELAAGGERLKGLFTSAFRPVLTPPWNRISPEVAARRREAGLIGLSAFARAHGDDPHCRNTHLDPIAWKRGRSFAGHERMLHLLDEELALAGGAPVGLLTHHLAHDEAVWGFTEGFVAAVSAHPAARWAGPDELFAGASPSAARA